MKNRNNFNHLMSIGLIISTFALVGFFAISQPVKAQSRVDLKVLKADEEAKTITSLSGALFDFFEKNLPIDLYKRVMIDSEQDSQTKTERENLKAEGEKVKTELKNTFLALTDLISKLKKANLWDEQFDKDVAKLIKSNEIKGWLDKSGGGRKLLESGVSATSVNRVKKEIDDLANLIKLETLKSKDVCKFMAIGIVVRALREKKSTSLTVKGCKE